MVLKVNMTGATVDTTPKNDATTTTKSKVVQNEQQTVPMVENHESDLDIGVKVEHQEEPAVVVSEEEPPLEHVEVKEEEAPVAQVVAEEPPKPPTKKVKINMGETKAPDKPDSNPAVVVAAEEPVAEVTTKPKEQADEPEDETLAAINRRLEAQQRQIEEQNRIIAQLREQQKADALKAKQREEQLQQQANAKVEAAQQQAAAAQRAAKQALAANEALLETVENVSGNEKASEQPAVPTGRPMPEPGYEALIGKNSKELRKIIRTSKDPKEVENAKIQLEAIKYEKGIWTPTELSDNQRSLIDAAVAASGSDKPFYKNKKAQKLLRKQFRDKSDNVVAALDKKIEEAKTEEEKAALKKFRDALADKNVSKKYAKTVVRDLKISDKVEHTIVVDSQKEKKAMKEKLDDEAEDYRVKVHNKRFMKHNTEVEIRMAQAEAAGNPISSHQAVYEELTTDLKTGEKKRISGDGTFEKSEIYTTAGLSSDDKRRYLAARNELRKLGYKIDDDLAKKILMPIVSLLAAGAGAGAGVVFAGGLSTVVEATATALAEVVVAVPELGIAVSGSSSSKASTSVTVNHWQNSAISAATAALISAAMFGSESEEMDLLSNRDRCAIFNDIPDGKGGTVREFELGSYGNKKKTKSTKAILREIDKLDLTDEQKVALLKQAAGEKGLGKITAKELILAYIKGMDMVAGAEEPVEPDKTCTTCQNDDDDCNCDTDSDSDIDIDLDMDTDTDTDIDTDTDVVKDTFEIIPEEGTKTRTVATVKWGGPYHYAQFYLVDGKPIKYKSPEYKAIIAKLNNGSMMEANGRKDRVLSEEIDLGNGKVAKLVSDERIAEIRATFRTKPGGKDVRYKMVKTDDGKMVLYRIKPDGTRIKEGEARTPEEIRLLTQKKADLEAAEEAKTKQ